MRKKIAILGSSGSIGVQALSIIHDHPEQYELVLIMAGNNIDLLLEQTIKFQPVISLISNKDQYLKRKSDFEALNTAFDYGQTRLKEHLIRSQADLVLNAIVGFAGLIPSLITLECRLPLALANKESLVVGGKILTEISTKNNLPILPVDSEHSAIFQCLQGEQASAVEKLILTASGGPFRGRKQNELENISVKQALNHPRWKMGDKITIDSATLMNKGLEVIEAKWLFNIDPDKIEVVVHPESIIHSLVQFHDGSIKAQLGLPDMRTPIQYAFAHPLRHKNNHKRLRFSDFPKLHFEEPDLNVFHCLKLAFEAIADGGNRPCVLNAANEIAVQAFLEEKISFLAIPKLIEDSMKRATFITNPDVESLINTDRETRIYSAEILNKSLI